ncbi:MAG TPA: response regulator [Nitrososphaeraceae archaeon]
MISKQTQHIDKRIRRSILVCDDESDLLLMFQIHLESQYNVLTVVSGRECIDKIIELKKKDEKIDLVLLDYKLGDISGENVARKIREIEKNIKILMITAFELEDHVVKNMIKNRYINDIINKPIQLEELSKKIEEHLD